MGICSSPPLALAFLQARGRSCVSTSSEQVQSRLRCQCTHEKRWRLPYLPSQGLGRYGSVLLRTIRLIGVCAMLPAKSAERFTYSLDLSSPSFGLVINSLMKRLVMREFREKFSLFLGSVVNFTFITYVFGVFSTLVI